MSVEENVQIVKHFFAAICDVCWRCLTKICRCIVPGQDWPLAGTRRGHGGLADLRVAIASSARTSAT